jgi:aminoglycoside phosphotransferase (APT) family kinase protein
LYEVGGCHRALTPIDRIVEFGASIDTIIAWSLLPPDARQAYRQALGVDDATWERGKGWVLSGVVGISYYRETNPVLVANQIRAVEAVLADRD